MSQLLCWSRVSLPQLHGALQPRERHLESTVHMSIRMSFLSLSLICYFLSVYSELRQCMLTLDRSSSFILSVYSELFVLSFWPIVSVFFFVCIFGVATVFFWKGRLHCDSVCHTLPVYLRVDSVMSYIVCV